MMGRPAKRFYAAAAVVPAADGFTVVLDGRPARTPAGAPLTLSNRALAQALAEEWAAQDDTIDARAMPLTGLANAAIDHGGGRRRALVDGVLATAATDLLCYRAEAPAELVERQARAWQPLLDWAAKVHGARLVVTSGVVPVAQPAAALAALGRAVENLDDARLVSCSAAAGATESVVIGLALVAGRIDAGEAWETSQVDESFQRQRWGEDAEDMARCQRIKVEIEAAGRFAVLARDPE
jgi:chaperone required for assembly of F1-ATPase